MAVGISDLQSFERLTPFRVRDVLLVASPFDHYLLEESGYLAEIMRREYTDLNLSQAPRIIHSHDADDALELLANRDFDLIITMVRVGTMDPYAFGRRAKRDNPDLPVIMLSHNTRELATLHTGDGIDRIFVWTGDSRILLSICKLIEDEKNAENDVENGDVQVILLVEDSRRFYSAYLPLLYSQLVNQTTRLMGEGGNLHERLLRLRARAKILLASDYPTAKSIIDKYHHNIIGVFTDGKFPDPEDGRDTAGLKLVRYVRSRDLNLPILFQSKNLELKEEAEALGVRFLHKEDTQLYGRIADFMLEEMSFGDFIFKLPDGTEVGRAANLRQLVEELSRAPIESVEYHATRNHFSHWLRTRTEFSLAAILRHLTIGDFESTEEIRDFILNSMRGHIDRVRNRSIRDNDSPHSDQGFLRIGRGSLGGKGRGLAFFFSRMPDLGLQDKFPDVEFIVPHSIVLATDLFEEFIEMNGLSRFAHEEHDDSEVDAEFLASKFSEDVEEELTAMLGHMTRPLAIRSSSLLEDASHQPFAGVYATHMIANDHSKLDVRLARLKEAIKLVFASTYHKGAKAYVAATPSSIQDERMAVVIQEIVGREVNGRYYPYIAGAARSRNHYPVSPLIGEDGIAAVCIGLGRQVASGEKCLRFSPGQPRRIHQFHSTEAMLDTSQTSFWAIPMGRSETPLSADETKNLVNLGLGEAEEDGRLALVGSTYVVADDRVVDSVRASGGPRVVTFAPILKHSRIPLAEILDHVLKRSESYLNSPIEIEFALVIDEDSGKKIFAILQVRPMLEESVDIDIDMSEVDRTRAIIMCSKALGNGVIDDIQDVVYIHPDRLDRMRTADLTDGVEAIDATLRSQGRSYLLIGPGRWGSSDPSLGIPVSWEQISGAKAIVEVPMSDIHLEPSQGTHFYQNIVTFNIGYLTITADDMLDFDWLDSIAPETEIGPLRHIALESPLKVVLDSRDSEAIVLR